MSTTRCGNTAVLQDNVSNSNLTNHVIHYGTKYATRMVLPHVTTGGLPDFIEISQGKTSSFSVIHFGDT